MAQPKVKVRFEVEGDEEARRKIKRTTDEAESGADRLDKRFAALGNTLKVLGIGTLLGAALGAAIRETMEAERVSAQLEARLKSTGGAAGVTKRQLESMAEGLQGVTTYSDEAVLEMQTLLLTFTQIKGQTVKDATTAILDISTAMGTDLKSSAIQVGKALNDPIKGVSALAEVGVSFTDVQKDVIKKLVETGDMAGAQAVILRELAVEFGGAAEAARDTFGGALEALKNTLGDVVEGGDGSLSGATRAVNDLSDTLGSQSTKDGINSMIEGLGWILTKAIEATAAIGGLGNAAAEAFNSSADKSYNALLSRRVDLEDRIHLLDEKTKGLAANTAKAAQILGVGLSKSEAEDELKFVQERLERLRALKEFGAQQANRPPGEPLSATIKIHPDASRDSGGKSGRSDVEREAERAAREQERAMERQQKAAASFKTALEDLRAEMGGPLAQVNLEYARKEAELNELAKEGKVNNEDLAAAIAILHSERDKEVKAINDQLTPTEKLIDDMEFELSLIGLSNAERQTAISLRQLEGKATEEQAAHIRELNQSIEDQRKAVEQLDEARNTLSDFFQDLAQNGLSAFDRLTDHIKSIILQRLGDQFAESILGGFGTSGGGAGGWLGSLFGSLFGSGSGGASAASGTNAFAAAATGGWSVPGFAHGTDFAPGGLAWVGEKGIPELVNLPRGSQVIPLDKLQQRSAQPPINFGGLHFHGPTTKEVAQYAAREIARKVMLSRRSS